METTLTKKSKSKIRMAHGMYCPKCNRPMSLVREDNMGNGRYRVTYRCANCAYVTTVFE